MNHMLILVIIVLAGVIFSLFATQNTQTTDIFINQFTLEQIPVFLIILVSLLVGIFITWFLHILGDYSKSKQLKRQKENIRKMKRDITKLTKEVHQLELENTELKSNLGEEIFDEESI